MIVKNKMLPKCITVWYTLLSGRIIGPFFVGNEVRNAVRVNDERYRNRISPQTSGGCGAHLTSTRTGQRQARINLFLSVTDINAFVVG